MFKKTSLSLCLLHSFLILSGCSPNEQIDQSSEKLTDVIYINEERVLFMSNNQILEYEEKSGKSKSIVDLLDQGKFSTAPDGENVFFYSFNKEENSYYTTLFSTSSGELHTKEIDLDLDPSQSPTWISDETVVLYLKLNDPHTLDYQTININSGLTETHTIAIEDHLWFGAEISPSQEKIAYTGNCVIKCHLIMKDTEKNSIGKVDYNEAFSTLWSPNGEYLAYVPISNVGPGEVKLFNPEKDPFGKEELDPLEETYTFYSNSKLLLPKNSRAISKLIRWDGNDSLIFQTKDNGTTFWKYATRSDTANEIAKIPSSTEWTVEDSTISYDLKQIAYIKTFEDKQELWLANLDGSDAEMIYKNYQ